MIKVLHISKRYPPYIGGIETECHDICESLKGRVEQKVVAFNDGSRTIEETYDGIDVIRVGVQTIVSSQPLAKDYGKIIHNVFKTYNPDIIHFQYPNPFAAFFVLREMKRVHFKGKFILNWNCDIIKQKFLMKFFNKQNIELINRADIVTVITPTYVKDTSYLPYYKKDYELLSCRIGDSRIKVTDNQREIAKQIRSKYQNKKICFFFGRHVEYKGLTYLIDSDKYLNQKDVQIIIGGSGPLTNQLKKQASSYSNIIFTGRLSDDEINAYLLACDIFVFPSITRNEAFGISLAEAMYFGKPSVTFTIKGSGVNWVSLNGLTGLEVENKNSKEYAKAVQTLCDNDALRIKLGKNAKQRADELFSVKKFSENVNSIYSKLIKEISNE
jgi:glycosyltransferase involved in cell wall biosynthesis